MSVRLFACVLGVILLAALQSKAVQPGDAEVSWFSQLDGILADEPSLTATVRELVKDAPSARQPDLAVITYHVRNQQMRDVVVQVYRNNDSPNAAPLIRAQGVVNDRLGDRLGEASGKFLGLVLQRGQYFGDPVEVSRQQRAMKLSIDGDLSLLREQTIEPLHVVAILPQAGRYLPSSLSSHVQTAVLRAQLSFGEWRGKVSLIVDEADHAEQVGNVVAGWRDLAGSLAGAFASYGPGQRLQDALKETTVQVVNDRITASGALPAATMVRVAKEMAGHGGGCPPGGVCGSLQVAICHEGNTICVSPAVVASHLAHGDQCGPCSGTDSTQGDRR